MRKLSWLAAACLLATASAGVAEDTAAEAKDRLHEKERSAKIDARQAKPGRETMKDRADDTADTTKAVGARAARTSRKARRHLKAGVHRGANELSRETETKK